MTLIVLNKVKLLLKLLLLIAISLVSLYGYFWVMNNTGGWGLLGVLLLLLLRALTSNRKNKVLIGIYIFSSLILEIIFFSLKVMAPVMIILTSYLFLFIIAFGIPGMLFLIINSCLELNILNETILFVVLAFGSISSVYGSKWVHTFIKNFSPINIWGNPHKLYGIDLALYVVSRGNMNFLIYMAYFLYLTVSGFMLIQYNEPFITSSVDGAVIKAFLVFIAFSNMIAKSKEVDMKTDPLLDKVRQLMSPVDKV